MQNLIFTKVWEDTVEPFCEIECTAVGNEAAIKKRFYVTNEALEHFAQSLISFAYQKVSDFEWNEVEHFSIRLFTVDASMHIRAEILASVDELYTNTHKCCFYMDGLEFYAIEKFAKKINCLKLNETIYLVEEN